MKTWKLIAGFLVVSLLSASVAIGVYSYLNRKDGNFFSNNSSNQPGFQTVGYAPAAENTDFTYAAEQTVNAVVHIKSVVKPSNNDDGRRGRGSIDPFEFFFGGNGNPFFDGRPSQRGPQVGYGSGVIISNDGYIVTNNHVVDGADEIEVTTNDDRVFKAKVVGSDERTDVALLKVEGKDFHALPFGDSDILKVGEWVLAVGNPFNLTSTVTAGIVSAKGRGDITGGGYGSMSAQDKIQSYIQTDAAVNPGNSGGALVNTKGELVGINTAIISETGNYVGYSFAIPINLVKKAVSDLKQYGVVQRALLGVKIFDLAELKQKEPDKYGKIKLNEGVYVDGFSSSSSAQKAGIQVGDIITAINGTKVKTGQELRAQISRFSPGDKVEIQVSRNDDTKKYTIELKNDQGTTEVIKQRNTGDILGATFKELSAETKTRAGINYGVEVADLSNGKLKAAGVKKGFIILSANDNRVSSPDDIQQVVSSVLKQDPDDRGLYIKGFYPDTRRMEYFAIDLNN